MVSICHTSPPELGSLSAAAEHALEEAKPKNAAFATVAVSVFEMGPGAAAVEVPFATVHG